MAKKTTTPNDRNGKKDPNVFSVWFRDDEMAILRFMAICQESLDPDTYHKDFIPMCRILIRNRNLGEGCLDKIQAYLDGRAHSWPVHTPGSSLPES